MTPEDLVARYPQLFHVAYKDTWPAIRDHGLLSTKALLDAYGLSEQARAAAEDNRRADAISIISPGLPGATIRDQRPMSDPALRRCLVDGLTPTDWYRLLNGYSFFWLSTSRVRRLLAARALRDIVQTVLVLDSAELVSAYRDRIRLSGLNSGSTIRKALPRGKATFMTIGEFPFAVRAKRKPLADNVVELVVDYSVPDVKRYVRGVYEVQGIRVLKELYRSPTASEWSL